jgi:hypothetical protein
MVVSNASEGLMRRTSLIATLCLLAAAPSAAQELLPATFGARSTARFERYPAGRLEAFAGGDAAILREYGAQAAERRVYRAADGAAADLSITAYRFKDATAAYGALTFLRTAEMAPVDISEHAAGSGQRLLALAGNLLLEAHGRNLASAAGELRGLAAHLRARAEAAPLPVVRDYLPVTGRVKGSERFVLGPAALRRFVPLREDDWVGFASGAEVELAQYRVAGSNAMLVLALFPTPKAAADRQEKLRRWFNVDAEEERVAGRPILFARRKASLLAVVTGVESANSAAALLDAIRYHTEVTWNEPGFKATERPWGETVVLMIYGTGAIMMLAVVAGLAFGGVRLAIKRLLPGKVFDRDASVEIIQLGLGSKPIQGKDFY